MTHLLFLILLQVSTPQPAQTSANRETRVRELIAEVARSGRVVETVRTEERLADPRKSIAPGAPPLLSFRYFEGVDRHRFGKLDVMMDDAGH